MIAFIFPCDYFNSNKVDECFADEAQSLSSYGFETFSFSFEKAKNLDLENKTIIYRGWMLSENEYSYLEDSVRDLGGEMLTNIQQYYQAHYIRNWYQQLSKYTPESVFIDKNDLNNLSQVAKNTGWDHFFIKDYVKSLTTKRGSICTLSDINDIAEKINSLRGIEGGICLRKVHNFKTESEIRYFVFNGKLFSPNQTISQLATHISQLVALPFYSIDIIIDEEGKEWLVEIGDGQVSSFKEPWDLKEMPKIFKS